MGLVERGKEMQDLDAPRPGKSRDLFGVQLERWMTRDDDLATAACKIMGESIDRKIKNIARFLLRSISCDDFLHHACKATSQAASNGPQVTSLLLEAERRKLAVLQRELQAALAEGGSVKVKEKQRQELLHAISKIQAQHQQLDKEYRTQAASVLLCNSRASGKLHEHMTEDEVKSLFHQNLDTMDDVEYEVVQLFHKDASHANDKVRRSLRYTYLETPEELNLELRSNILAGPSTPFIEVSVDPNTYTGSERASLTYSKSYFTNTQSYTVYQDPQKNAALVMHRDSYGRAHFNGVVGDDVAIRSLPSRVHDIVSENPTKFYDSVSSDSEDEEMVHHVIIKTDRSKRQAGNYYSYSNSRFHEPICADLFPQSTLEERNNPNSWTPVDRKNSSFSEHVKRPSVVYPEVLIVVDYETWAMHQHNLVSLHTYMIAFWNAVDLRFRTYKSEPRVLLNIAAVLYPKDKQSAVYMEHPYYNDGSRMRADCSLDVMKQYFKTKNFKEVRSYDFVVGVTSRHAWSYNHQQGRLNEVNGIAIQGGACDVNVPGASSGSSIIRHDGAFTYVQTAAHEIGHLLGADHDPKNDGGPCTWNERMAGYLMSYNRKDEKGVLFSSCSQNQMSDFMGKEKARCLWNKPKVEKPYPKLYPGKILNRDEQCKRTFRGSVGSSKAHEHICTQLYCLDERGNPQETNRLPAEGSYCAPGKSCYNAHCSDDSYAPGN